MMKKEIKTLSAIFSIIFFIALMINFVYAADVAYIYKNYKKIDSAVLDVFDEMQMEVDFIKIDMIWVTDFSKYRLVFIGDERLKHADYFPVESSPAVIMNPYYAKEFGLSRKGRVISRAANNLLKGDEDGNIFEVYKLAKYKQGGAGIPYYYLPDSNKYVDLDSVVRAFPGAYRRQGDLVSYSEEGNKKCFFGITKSKFWTPEARELFKNCINFVLKKFHNVAINDEINNSLNGIVIRDLKNNVYLMDETAKLEGGEEYEIKYEVLNLGDYTEDVDLLGNLASMKWKTEKNNLDPGKSAISTKRLNITADKGNYLLEIYANLTSDNDPSNNYRVRKVEIVCEIGKKHDVKIDESYSNSVNGIRIKDVEINEYLMNETARLNCYKEYKIDFKTLNVGDYEENVTLVGILGTFNWSAIKEGLNSGASTTTGSKTFNASERGVSPGVYDLMINAMIAIDANTADNSKSRKVEIICPPLTEQPKTYLVNISNSSFIPQNLTVKKNDIVVWTNKDSAPHTVTSDTGSELNSETLSNGENFNHTFINIGTFDYHCSLHPGMKGKIVVE